MGWYSRTKPCITNLRKLNLNTTETSLKQQQRPTTHLLWRHRWLMYGARAKYFVFCFITKWPSDERKCGFMSLSPLPIHSGVGCCELRRDPDVRRGHYKYLSCVPGVDGNIHPEDWVQHSFVTALLHEDRGMDFPIHIRNTWKILVLTYFISFKFMVPEAINKQRDLFLYSKTRA